MHPLKLTVRNRFYLGGTSSANEAAISLTVNRGGYGNMQHEILFYQKNIYDRIPKYLISSRIKEISWRDLTI